MPTPETFLDATKWMGIATLGLAALTALAFFTQWGIRFRLFGITSFCAVLTVGVFGLGFQPVSATIVDGSVPYTTVYDSGSAQLVISVPPTITETQLEATLQQAAINSFNPSRLGSGQPALIRARTIIHREPGISDLAYIGQIRPDATAESGYQITLDASQLTKVRANANA